MIYTFYSFKGGVGRSMSLANVAEIFYRAGLSVLMIDWDLEAPGLERFFPNVQAKAVLQPGIMEMLAEYKRIMARPAVRSGDGELPFEELDDYMVNIYPAPEADDERPSLTLMTSGRHDEENFSEYSQKVLRFDWKEFYDRWAGEAFFEWFRKYLDSWDIVLIDSRTGITEIGGVCTYQLADVVIMFCASNDQNMDGSYEMARKFTSDALVKYRHGRPLEVVVVPSRVDKGDSVLVNRFQGRFIKRFREFSLPVLEGGERQFWELNIPYASSYAFEESVAVRQADLASAEAIVEAYLTLARAMTRLADPESRVANSRETINQISRRAIAEDTTPGTIRAFPTANPFVGPRPFDSEDAPVFFGREQLVADVIGRLREHNLVAVIGASGSGKSTLLRAGVVPALRSRERLADGSRPPVGSDRWRIVFTRPMTQPLLRLANDLLGETEGSGEAKQLAADLYSEPKKIVEAIGKSLSSGEAEHLLLVVDQFEDLYTLTAAGAEREAAIKALVHAADSGRASIILSVRADFYGYAFEQLSAHAAPPDLVFVGPMTHDELRDVIVEPARLFNVDFESGLVQRIIDDLTSDGDQVDAGALPLLQITLWRMWQRREGGLITHSDYEAVGGALGSLAQTAERAYKDLGGESQDAARDILLRLVDVGEGGVVGRRVVPLGELQPGAQGEARTGEVLQKLAEARLVTISEDNAMLAHEALIGRWPRLSAWLDESREALRVQRRLSQDARAWAEGRLPLLHDDVQLAQIEQAIERSDLSLTEEERAFVVASREYLVSQQRRQRVRVIGLIVLVIALIGTIGFGTWQFTSARDAEAENLIVTAERVAVQSISVLQEDRQLALLLATQAVSITLESEDYATDRAKASLYQALRLPDWTITEPEAMRVSAVTADGVLRAEVAETGLVVIRRVATGNIVSVAGGHQGGINAMAFSLDGNQLATAGNDGIVQLSDVFSGNLLAILEPHHGPVVFVTYNGPGQIATFDETGLAALWWADGSLITHLESEEPITEAAFMPDETQLVTGNLAGGIRYWSAETGEQTGGFDTGEGGIIHLDMRPEGVKFLTVAGANQSIKVWEYTGELLASLEGHDSEVIAAAFGPDGDIILTAELDGIARFWRPETGELIAELSWRQPGLQLMDVHMDEHAEVMAINDEDDATQVWFVWNGLEDALPQAYDLLERDRLTEPECIRFNVQVLDICS